MKITQQQYMNYNNLTVDCDSYEVSYTILCGTGRIGIILQQVNYNTYFVER